MPSCLTRLGAAMLGAVVVALAPLAAGAQGAYPTRPVHIIVPQAAGSGGDVLARMMSEALAPKLGQPIVVENRPGANGVVAASMVAKDNSAGYQLLLTGVSVLSFNPSLYKNLPYKPFEDFAFIAPVADTPFVFLASKASGIRTVQDLLDRAKAAPAPLRYGNAGNGNSTHLAGEMVASAAGIPFTQISYRGSTPIFPALMNGEVDLTVGIPQSAIPFIQDGRVTAVASMTRERLPQLPEVPTFDEVGLKMPEMPGWYALVGPANMPAAAVQRLEALVREFVEDPKVQERLRSMHLIPSPGSAQEIRQRAMRDAEVWGELIVRNGIQLQ